MESASNDDVEARACAECPLEQLYKKLGTGPDGLTKAEAEERMKQHGPNLLPEKKKQFGQKLAVQLKNLFNVLLVVAAILSFISGVTSNDPTAIEMGFVILLVVLLSVVFSLFQERRAEKAVEAIRNLIPANAKVMRDGQVKQVLASEIVPGDLLILEAGDKIPADARVIACYELSVDNSPLTGEAEPQTRSVSPNPSADRQEIAACINLVFAGTTVVAGTGRALVIATGIDTEFGRVVKLTNTIVEPLSPLQLELNRAARLNFILAIAVGVVFLMIAFFGLHLQLSVSLLFMIGVMVSLVPEGFQVTLTLALALSSLAMSKRNVVVKRLSSVETLGSATVICTDKTGTITEGQMTVRHVWLGGSTLDVTGEGYEPEGAVLFQGTRVMASDREDFLKLCEVASLDNTATIVPPLDIKKFRWTAIGDTTEAALLVLAAKAGMQYKEIIGSHPRIGMIPFDSSRKKMTSVHRTKEGETVAYVKGAGQEVLANCTSVYWDRKVVPLTESLSDQISSQIDSFARGAYRVLALAMRKLDAEPREYSPQLIESQLTFVGLVAILDPPRAETPEAVRMARAAGIKVVMMTGDHELTAEAIARKVGIVTTSKAPITTGYALAQKSDAELSKLLESQEVVFARISPDQKLRVVRLLRASGETVAVTGDGVNDAPALLEADIGIAMGLSGTDVARESADMVLLDDNFASIVHGIEQGRSVFDNLKKFIVYVFAHNWAELVAFIVFVLLGTPLPLTVLGVLAIDLLMEIPPSLALTVEPPEPGIMDRPPRPKRERLFSAGALARSTYFGIVMGVAAILWCFHAWNQAGWTLGMSTITDQAAYARGTTIVIAAIMAGQLGTLLATRTNVQSSFTVGLARNKWILVAVAATTAILLAIIYVPFLNSIFATMPLLPLDLTLLYAIAPLVLILDEVRKYFLRTFILPARPVMAQPSAPLVHGAPTGPVGQPRAVPRPAFQERSGPIAVPLSIEGWDDNQIHVAFDQGRHSGSRIVFIRIVHEKEDEWRLDRLERSVESNSSATGVPYEYLDLRLLDKDRSTRTLVSSIKQAVRSTNPNLILLPVERSLFAGKRDSIRQARWVDEFSTKTVLLVANSDRPLSRSSAPRILIPVLDEFKVGSFELAEALTEDANVPDINIVAAKVIEMPPIVPIYSIYKPESLVNADKELASWRSLPGWAFLRRVRPLVLLVRETGRDLAYFAQERGMEVIIINGDRSLGRTGYLPKKERFLALRANCMVIVILPGLSSASKEVRK